MTGTTRAIVGIVLLSASLASAQPVPIEDADDRKALEARAALLDRRLGASFQQGRLTDALSLAEQVLSLRRKLYPKQEYPAGHPDLALSLNNLGAVLKTLGHAARAEALLHEALAMNRKLYPPERFANGHRVLATNLTNLGSLLRDQGELDAAEPYLRHALVMYQKLYPKERFADGHSGLATGLNNLAMLLQAQGDMAGAEPLLRDALTMRRKLYPKQRYPDGHPELAYSLNNLGMLLLARGELTAAEPVLRASLEMRQALFPKTRFPAGHPDLARSLNNLGFLLQSRRELDAAEPFYRDALAMRRAIFPKERYPAGHPELASSQNNLGSLLTELGQFAAAEPYYRECLGQRRSLFPKERFPDGSVELASSLNNLGMLLRSRGQLDAAEPHMRAALKMCRKLYPEDRFPAGHSHLALSLVNLGTLLLARGDAAAAELCCREALAMRQSQLDMLLTGAAEAEALNYLAQLPLAQDAYLTATRARRDAGSDVYSWVWQGRGVLARWLGRRRLATQAAAEPETRALANRLAQKRQALAALFVAHGPPTPAQVQRLRTLSDEKEELEKALARALPAFARQQQSARTSPDDLRRRLPEGVVYLDLVRYVRFEFDPRRPGRDGERQTPSYVAFVLCPGREVARVELGPAAPIDAAVTAWRAALTGAREKAAVPKPLRDSGKERPEIALRRLVWAPLAKHLPPGTRSVYLAPDGALSQLPWAALPGSKPATVLLEEVALAVVPHGQLLLEALEQSARRGSPRASRGRQSPEEGTLLVVGAVDYDRVARKDGKPPWGALPGTAQELARIRDLAGQRRVQSRQGAEASTTRLLAELPRARWVHLATHGFFADGHVRSVLHMEEKDYARGWQGERVGVGARSPLVLSGLVLAGANRPAGAAPGEDGGIVTAEAIAALDLDGLDLAVLSACETGLGEVAGGEGVFGLQRAFHVAGCKNVVASLWKVDDEATAALMGLFYHKLWQERLPPLEALRQAQLTLYRAPERVARLARARGPDFAKEAELPAGPHQEGRAPARLWAAFVLSGTGQ
jgi:CHAT domain-containing protein/tetratricopeptide (TPR) repeat protein